MRKKVPSYIDPQKDTLSFLQIPEWLLAHFNEISGGALLTYCVLRRIARMSENGHAFPSKQYLATQLNKSVSSIKDYIRELVELGLITTVSVAGTSNTYMFNAHRWMPPDFIAGLKIDDLQIVSDSGIPVSARALLQMQDS